MLDLSHSKFQLWPMPSTDEITKIGPRTHMFAKIVDNIYVEWFLWYFCRYRHAYIQRAT